MVRGPSSYLLASFNSPLQLPRLEKHFGVSFVLIRLVIGELLSEVGDRVGHGLVRVICASLSLFRQFFRIDRTRETLRYLIYPSPHRSS